MTLSLSTDKTWAANQPGGEWLIGNARLTSYSGLLLGAHIAHAGLIMFWAGSVTLMEAGRFNPEIPLPNQGLLLIPHLATLGFGFDELGAITHSYDFFVIGILHLVASAVLGAGGLFHVFKGPDVLSKASGRAAKFHYEWTDGASLSFILGHHLILLGLGALALVLKATQWGGLYDASIYQVRLVEHPTLNPSTIFGYLLGFNHGSWTAWGIASVSSLEDLVGGHVWLGVMLILGGIWHIAKPPSPWVLKRLPLNGDAVLSYSLGGLAFMGFVSSAFVAHSNLAFPAEFYGTHPMAMINIQLLLGAIALGGHLWHAYRAKNA